MVDAQIPELVMAGIKHFSRLSHWAPVEIQTPKGNYWVAAFSGDGVGKGIIAVSDLPDLPGHVRAVCSSRRKLEEVLIHPNKEILESISLDFVHGTPVERHSVLGEAAATRRPGLYEVQGRYADVGKACSAYQKTLKPEENALLTGLFRREEHALIDPVLFSETKKER